MITFLAISLMQGPSYFEQAFPNPTGNNGWEEYVMAADVMRHSDANRAVNRFSMAERKWDDSIEGARETVRKYRKACDLIRIGNKKPLVYPWKDDEHGMPNDPAAMTSYSNVVKLLGDEVRVRFADGNAQAAAESIVAGVEFARRYAQGSFIEALKGSAWHAMSLAKLKLHLHSLDLSGLGKVREAFEKCAEEQPPLVRSLFAGFERDRAEAKRIFDDLEEDSEFWEVPDEAFAIKPEQRAKYLLEIDREILSLQKKLKTMFAQEERFWRDPVLEHPDPVVAYAISQTLYANIPLIAVRNRTQMRLAALHCRVMEFKRRHNRFPRELAELGRPSVWYDPATGGPFFYSRLSEQSFTLYSTGTEETGKIGLSWRPPGYLRFNRDAFRKSQRLR
jgi:hypothetical protein